MEVSLHRLERFEKEVRDSLDIQKRISETEEDVFLGHVGFNVMTMPLSLAWRDR